MVTKPRTAATRAPGKPISSAARAKSKHAAVVQQAGALGHVVDEVPTQTFRTDLVAPVLRFVVYGVPAPQGSKRYAGHRGGKPVLKEQSDGLGPWRDAVRTVARMATQDWSRRTGSEWKALDEEVMVSATVTIPHTAAAQARGDIYATGTPDLDKLQRAIGDALAPPPLSPSDAKGMSEPMRTKVRSEMMRQRRAVSVLHDDSRIVVWERPKKVYPSTTVDSLGYPGVTIQVWRMSDLNRAAQKPAILVEGNPHMRADDLRSWSRPLSGRGWDDEASHLWQTPEAIWSDKDETVVLRGRGISEQGARIVLRELALRGPSALIRVVDEPPER